MADPVPRRRFLQAMGAAGTASMLSSPSLSTPAQAQASTAPANAGRDPADLVFKSGKVITVDAAFTIAQAVAIAGERIVAVGPDAAMAAHTGPATRVIDLNGKTAIPGITDGHAHMDREALREVFPSLGRVRSIRDIQDRIADLARAKQPGEWIVTMPIGDPPYYFDVPDILAEKRWPTRQDLDAAAPDNPVYIRSIWGYWRGTFPLVSCANSEALRRAGITRDTVAPVATLTIEKDGNGDPTGVIVEREMQPMAELIWFRQASAFTHADRLRALPLSARAYHAFGTTSVFEGHGVAAELLRVYKQAYREGTLTMRVMGRIQLQPRLAARASKGAAAPLREERHPRGHDRLAQSRPLRGGRPGDSARGAALGDQPHQHDLAARDRDDRPHGPGADHAHQQLSLQGAA